MYRFESQNIFIYLSFDLFSNFVLAMFLHIDQLSILRYLLITDYFMHRLYTINLLKNYSIFSRTLNGLIRK